MKSLWAFIIGFLLIGTATAMAEPAAFSFNEKGFEKISITDPVPEAPGSNIWSRWGYPDLTEWERPNVPPRVGLQVGHWQRENLPQELESLKDNTGATGGGKIEAEVALQIALEAKDILEANGVVVDILPSTVPVDYWADVFISIHADGSVDPTKSGYKVAAPWRDVTGKAERLSSLLEESYGDVTGMVLDTNVTQNMRGYYAFNWVKYDHAIHPMTPATILETGFLTSPKDQRLLIGKPTIPAEGLAEGVLNFLIEQGVK
jgi:N-acetylmuramoyl-L-alanine amidase